MACQASVSISKSTNPPEDGLRPTPTLVRAILACGSAAGFPAAWPQGPFLHDLTLALRKPHCAMWQLGSHHDVRQSHERARLLGFDASSSKQPQFATAPVDASQTSVFSIALVLASLSLPAAVRRLLGFAVVGVPADIPVRPVLGLLALPRLVLVSQMAEPATELLQRNISGIRSVKGLVHWKGGDVVPTSPFATTPHVCAAAQRVVPKAAESMFKQL